MSRTFITNSVFFDCVEHTTLTLSHFLFFLKSLEEFLFMLFDLDHTDRFM